MPRPVSFKASAKDRELIRVIVDRAMASEWMASRTDRRVNERMHLQMDITAVHANGNPLRLAELLQADEFNFIHDLDGIRNCIDRETAQLRRNFVPRFSVPERRRRVG